MCCIEETTKYLAEANAKSSEGAIIFGQNISVRKEQANRIDGWS